MSASRSDSTPTRARSSSSTTCRRRSPGRSAASSCASASGRSSLRASGVLVAARVCVDRRRIYLTGFSNGAGFAARAGCELADRVAAIAPVSGSYRTLDRCSGAAMPTLEVHGRDPWTRTVPAFIAATRARNGCNRAPVTKRIARGITRTRWPGCDLERILNSTIGHEWPRLGPYDTSKEVWRFISAYTTG